MFKIDYVSWMIEIIICLPLIFYMARGMVNDIMDDIKRFIDFRKFNKK